MCETRDVLLLDAVRLCAGVPARSTVRRDGDGVWVEDGGAPARCSKSDGRMIYGVDEAITRMMLRRLEKSRGWCSGGLGNQGSYDILMNGFFLQSTTTPRKACKDIESALIKASMVESDQGKWVNSIGIWDCEAWWYDPHKSRQISATALIEGTTSLNGAWDPEATWRFDHSIFGRVSHGPRPRPIVPWSRGREDPAFAAFVFHLGENV
ncbi:unnamed protein product [Prunus brigantina]